MASAELRLAAIIYLILSSLAISLQAHSLSDDQNLEEEEDEESEYVLDAPSANGALGTRRFLAAVFKLKKGARCNAAKNNVCDGVSANNGTSLLYCCKKHCRNILGDRNNCGACGHKCGFGQRCCNRQCTDILRNDNSCGKCGRTCSNGVPCSYGVCGYA